MGDTTPLTYSALVRPARIYSGRCGLKDFLIPPPFRTLKWPLNLTLEKLSQNITDLNLIIKAQNI